MSAAVSGYWLERPCAKCGEQALHVEAESAAHDESLIDLTVECKTAEGGCGQQLNFFVRIDEMQEVPR